MGVATRAFSANYVYAELQFIGANPSDIPAGTPVILLYLELEHGATVDRRFFMIDQMYQLRDDLNRELKKYWELCGLGPEPPQAP
jgi:hypothetical protein